MHTFGFVASLHEPVPESALWAYARVARTWTPSTGIGWEEGATALPECGGGWFWLAPAGEGNTLVTATVGERHAVIAFGDVLAGSGAGTADAVARAWAAGGAAAVQDLDGCFSAVVVERARGTAYLVADGIGRRALRYYVGPEGVLVAAPHEVPLLATGHCPTSYDCASAASILAAGWSLGGASLLQHVRPCRSGEYVRWERGRADVRRAPAVDGAERISSRDAQRAGQVREQMIAEARARTRAFAAPHEAVHVDLTAGLDSRAALGLLLAEVGPARIIASCRGNPGSLDVEVARRLARAYGVRFHVVAPAPRGADEFLRQCDLLAFALNGDTNGVRAASPLVEAESSSAPHVAGAGGEIFRGYYYPNPLFTRRPALSLADAARLLGKKVHPGGLPWRTAQHADAVAARFRGRVDELAAQAADGYDLLDLFYLRERFAVWGALQPRLTWVARFWSPFASSRLVKQAFTMPAPIGDQVRLQEACVRRFMPDAYWVRINRKALLPLERAGGAWRLLRGLDRLRYGTAYVLGQAWARRGLGRLTTQDQVRADLFAGPLASPLCETLTRQGSFALELLGEASVERLVREHTERTVNHALLLGILVIMERWRDLVEGVTHDATRTSAPRYGR